MNYRSFVGGILTAAALISQPMNVTAAPGDDKPTVKNTREIKIRSLDDLARVSKDKTILFPPLAVPYKEHLKTRGITDVDTLKKHLTGDPKEMDTKDVLHLLTFQKTYGKEFIKLRKNILKAQPAEYITALRYWGRLQEVEAEKGYLPNRINANSNLGFVWGGIERRFGISPTRSIRYLEKAIELSEICTDDKWVTRSEFWYQQDPNNRPAGHRKDPTKPQKISFPKERAFGPIYQEAGKLQTAAEKSAGNKDDAKFIFDRGIDSYINGVLLTNDRSCAGYLLPYSKDGNHRVQVWSKIGAALNNKTNEDKMGYKLLKQVDDRFRKIKIN